MDIKEILFILILVGGLLGPAAYVGQWWLFSVFCVFFLCFGVVELVSVRKTGKSVSQHFWDLSKRDKEKAWLVLVFMFLAWLSLLLHLGIKL